MSRFDWSEEKNVFLEQTRGISFDDVMVGIENGQVLDVIRHPNRNRYPGQNIIVLNSHPQSQSNKGVSVMTNTIRFDAEEEQILQDFERGEFQRIPNLEEEKKELEASARKTLQKDKRINIRISSRDLEALQRRALEEGLPYQSLVSSVLHKYVSGGLKDISANKTDRRTQ